MSLLLEGHPQISRRVAEVGAEVAITIVTVQELFNGWVVLINNANTMEDLIRLYGKLERTIALCKNVTVAGFDQAAGDRYQHLMQTPSLSKKRLQKDMRIAAIALTTGATLVTRNYRDFSQVPGLLLEDWT
ncbi:MAG TPA: type II toxin-antitoxin system VapC family toxin [Thermosynechococcaceae cyanobacterium]